MEIVIILAKSAAILTLFYVLYVAILKRETFFIAHRHYLLAGIVAALCIPFIAFTKTVYLDIPVVSPTPSSFGDLSPILLPETMVQETALDVDWWLLGLVVYGVGVIIMLSRLTIQLFSLKKLIHSYPNTKRGSFTYVQINDNIAPFSFFNYICYNPELHTPAELKMIIEHEKVHASQWHTLDVLFTQVVLAIQWINPIAWYYKKHLEQNLEFLADSGALRTVDSSTAYQHTLVKVSSTALRPALTNQFYHSLIKKRIVMLNKETSHRRNLWKLGLVLPLLGLFMYSFNVKEVIEYREETAFAKNTPDENKAVNTKNTFSLHPKMSDDELLKLAKKLEQNASSLKVRFTKAERNTKGELITIQVETKYPEQLRFYKNVTYGGNKKTSIPKIMLQIVNDNDLQFYDSGNELVFTTSIDGVKAKLFSKVYNPISQPSLGENPVYIINGQKKTSQEVKGKTLALDGEVEVLEQKEATQTYGEAAKDGTLVFHGTTRVKEENTPPTEPAIQRQEKHSVQQNPATVQSNIRVPINKNTTDIQLDELKAKLLGDHNIDLSYNIRRNEAREITSIQISYTGNGKNGNYSISGGAPIDEFFFVMDEEGKTGFWSEQNEARLKERKEQLEERRSQLTEARGERSEAYAARREKLEEARKELQEAMEGKREEMNAHMKERAEALKERMQGKSQALQERQQALEQNSDKGYVTFNNTTYYFANVDSRTKFYTRFGEEIPEKDPLYEKLFQQKNKDATQGHPSVIDGGVSLTVKTLTIDKNSTDTQLTVITKQLAQDGATLNISKIKRNAAGEIVGYRLKFDDGNGSKVSSSKKGGQTPITLFVINYDQNGKISLQQ